MQLPARPACLGVCTVQYDFMHPLNSTASLKKQGKLAVKHKDTFRLVKAFDPDMSVFAGSLSAEHCSLAQYAICSSSRLPGCFVRHCQYESSRYSFAL